MRSFYQKIYISCVNGANGDMYWLSQVYYSRPTILAVKIHGGHSIRQHYMESSPPKHTFYCQHSVRESYSTLLRFLFCGIRAISQKSVYADGMIREGATPQIKRDPWPTNTPLHCLADGPQCLFESPSLAPTSVHCHHLALDQSRGAWQRGPKGAGAGMRHQASQKEPGH